MKAMIKKASDWDYEEIREINTLTELKEIYSGFVIDFNPTDKNVDVEIWIYDDYMEQPNKLK